MSVMTKGALLTGTESQCSLTRAQRRGQDQCQGTRRAITKAPLTFSPVSLGTTHSPRLETTLSSHEKGETGQKASREMYTVEPFLTTI